MQLVNAIDIPFGVRLPVGHKVHGFAGAFLREIAGMWVRVRNALPETAATAFHSARTPVGRLGYYGGAYDRLRASMPMVSYVECVGTAPFLQPSTSQLSTVADEKAERASRPGEDDESWLGILRADLMIPAMMM